MGVETKAGQANTDMSSPALQSEMTAMEQEAYFKTIQDDLADKGFVITSVEDIIAWARETMANYKVPRGVTLHKALPRNASGKVQKYLLKA